MAMPSSVKIASESREDSWEVFLARSMVSPTNSDKEQREVAVSRNGGSDGADSKNSRTDHARRQFCSEDHDQLKIPFDQVCGQQFLGFFIRSGAFGILMFSCLSC